MRKLLLFILPLMLFFVITAAGWYHSRFQHTKMPVNKISLSLKDSNTEKRINTYAARLREYAYAKKYNGTIGFLVDMSIESGKNRFFIVSLEKDSILDQGLVTHGRCNQNWLTGRRYSNTLGGGCTSLGKYKIGQSYQGRFGLAYKLFGLDSTNSNSFKRFVVLHSMKCIPEKETHPFPLCQSDGCPAVAPEFLKKLQRIISLSAKPVILWIYD